MTSGIYSIYCCATGYRYIGSSKRIEWQWEVIKRQLNQGKFFGTSPKKIITDWQKYGEDAFWWGILESMPDSEFSHRDERRQFWIKQLRPSYNGGHEWRNRRKVAGVYVIRNKETGECYVGASRDIATRWRSHKLDMNHAWMANKRFSESVRHYGPEAFEFQLLEECEHSQLRRKEMEWYYKLQPKLNGLRVIYDGTLQWRRYEDNG